MNATVRLGLLGLASTLLPAAFAGPPEPAVIVIATVTVRGGGTALGETPIVVPMEERPPQGFYLLRSERSRPIPASVFYDGTTARLAAVLDSVPASGEAVYKLIIPPPNGEPSPRGIEFTERPGAVAVSLDGDPFTTCLFKTGPKPFYFPLIGPTGKRFTRAYPMEPEAPGEKHDHPHQRSMWFTHGKVNGVDFWAETKGHGSIVETSRQLIRGAPVAGIIRTTDDWLGPDGKPVCKDERKVTFYDTHKARMLDFDITIKATDGPVTFGDTKEGMFGVRVASSMDVDAKKGGKITNAEGLTDAAAWGKPSPWVDYTGPVEGETVGIAILNHPASFRHPTTWHVRTYGLFAANPFGWHDFGMKTSGDHTIPAGGSIHFGYRVILHVGDTASADLPAAYAAYAKPPTVEIKPE
jgi:hypothetical protein